MDPAKAAPLPRNPADFEAIYRAEFKNVWRFLSRLGARGSLAEDLTHDVFLTAWRRVESYDPSRPAGAWLKGIAWRVAADHRRLHSQKNEVPETLYQDEGNQVPDTSYPPDEAISRRQAREILDEALASLDFEKRTVFVLHDIEGLTAPEIAATMDAPLATTYSRLRLARQAMTEALHRIRLRRGIA